MTAFVVVLLEPDEEAWKKLNEHWKATSLVLDDRLAFIADTDDLSSSLIAERLGMNKENSISGMVVDATHLSGWGPARIKDWLGKHRG